MKIISGEIKTEFVFEGSIFNISFLEKILGLQFWIFLTHAAFSGQQIDFEHQIDRFEQ